MKKFNADGGHRKDTMEELNARDLNRNLKGYSLEESKDALEDTTILSQEDLDNIRAGMHLTEEEREEIVNMSR